MKASHSSGLLSPGRRSRQDAFLAAKARADGFVAAWVAGEYERAARLVDTKSLWWFGLSLPKAAWARLARRAFARRVSGARCVGAFDHLARAQMDADRLSAALALPIHRQDGMFLYDFFLGAQVVTVGVVADQKRVSRVFDPEPLKTEGSAHLHPLAPGAAKERV